MRRLKAIIRKEFLHILRDPRSLMILFVMPFMMMILFGYAVRLDIKNIPLAVRDDDNSPESREVIRVFRNSGYFTAVEVTWDPLDPDRVFRDHIARAVLTIPEDFGQGFVSGQFRAVQFLTDATESNTATIAGQYAEQIMITLFLANSPATQALPDVRSLILFNPEFESTHFIVPGLVAILFMMVCAILTSVTIAREKETGTLEQMLVSPVRVREIIIGKVLPYVVLAGVLGVLVVTVSMQWFGVPFRGNPWALAAVSLIYLVASLGIGIFISTKVKTMQVALMLALVTTMLPSVMLSGFMFSIASMPLPIRFITHIVPARYFLVIIRGVMLKGVGLEPLAGQILALGIFAFVLLTVSVRRFKATLE